jgi:murein DD-endopeptidase MepM/ murein hydrolase activator NlpD
MKSYWRCIPREEKMSNRKLVQIVLFLGLFGIIAGMSLFAYRERENREVVATDDFIDYKEALEKKIIEKNIVSLGEENKTENDSYQEGSEEYVDENFDGGIEILEESLLTFEKEYVLPEKSENKKVEEAKEEEETRVTYYVVKRGDSLYKISKNIGVDMNILIANNPSVKGGIIRIGQKLKILNNNSIEYTVKKGDSLIKIANKYNVKLANLLADNDLNTTNIVVGDRLIVKNPDLKFINLNVKPKNYIDFRWPIRWAGVTSPYGKRFHPVLKRNIFHAGVDLRAQVGVPLYAPADGTIKTAGWLGGYGKIIIIRHAKGYETRSAHLNNIYVKVGQKVKKGDLIGKTGKTGRITGPHLHYEIRRNGKTLNPIEFRK